MNKNTVALVTGANKGIGFETARQLGKRGFTVLLGARNATSGTTAADTLKSEGIDAAFVLLDVTDQATIGQAVRLIGEKYGRLDVLINNAGVFLEKGRLPGQLDLQTLRNTFEVNFFGVFAVTTAFLPLLQRSSAGRIVNVSSGQGSLERSSRAGTGRIQLAYNSSKAALNMLTIQFAKELAGTPIKINSAAPGFTVTDLNEGKGSKTPAEASRIIVQLATLDENGTTGGFFEEAGDVPW
jgi:NAD(P)-dependent dehydrogenase (short-subunit alcohol dehydrogenase family)